MSNIDFVALEQALTNVSEKRFYAELREALIYSPPLITEIFGEYLKVVEQNKAAEINIDE